ncbi:sugar ABC transporter substrate-binding protein [Virgisporangium aliadipatigenens]|uniref:Sugar ABC transporter substrate-binding protein n=1 Tax=Virgisporangium aliadipatigenens TaxID=741659 RepID=A0A8J4DSS1_9ACTN|nr:extracellular solute-binding protein [Virgisporangium aliadipatigenens]GIJ49014.1 sugar ABC transporter substrate-binding protein [Virgisporangium aliadipatigenens]
MRPIARWAAAAVALVALVGSTAACGDDSGDGPVTLRFTWWGNADRAELTEKALDAFEAEHTDIKVETSYAEFNAYWQKMATEIAGGSAPDVLQMDYRYVREYADRNVLAEFGGSTRVDTSKFSQSLIKGGTVGGKVYAIPMGQNTQEFTWDPAAWQAAGATPPADGWTWNDLETAAGKVSASTGNKVRGVVDFGMIEDWFEVWLRQQGKALYTDDGKLAYTAADVQKYWEFTDRLRRSGAATQADVTSKVDGSQANDPVTQKTAASGFGYDSGFTPKTWEIMGREMKLAPFPTSGGDLGQYAKPSMLISVAKRSKHPKEAAQLIDFLLNDKEVGTILGTSRGMPVNSEIRDAIGAALTGPPKVAYEFEKQILPKLKDAPPPPPKGSGAVKAAFQRVYDDVMFQRSSIPAAAEKFMNEAKQALAA